MSAHDSPSFAAGVSGMQTPGQVWVPSDVQEPLMHSVDVVQVFPVEIVAIKAGSHACWVSSVEDVQDLTLAERTARHLVACWASNLVRPAATEALICGKRIWAIWYSKCFMQESRSPSRPSWATFWGLVNCGHSKAVWQSPVARAVAT